MSSSRSRRPLHPETLALLKKTLAGVSEVAATFAAPTPSERTRRPKLSPATAALLLRRTSESPVAAEAAEILSARRAPEVLTLTPTHGVSLDDVVIFDTETTGAGRGARLVEIAGLHARHGKVLRSFQTLVDPETHIPAFVTAIHGITDAMVRGAPRVGSALRDFFEFVGDLPLVAHNASFDRGILRGELERAGLSTPTNEVFCTLKLSRKLLREMPNHKLATLAHVLRLPTPPVHRAEADCHAALGVFRVCELRAGERGLRAVHGPSKPI